MVGTLMANEELYFNGVNGTTGEYLLGPRTALQVAASIREDLEAKTRLKQSESALRVELKRREAEHQEELETLRAELERVKAELRDREAWEKAEAVRQAELQNRDRREKDGVFGVASHIKDPSDLAQTGWGVIVAHDADPAVLEALRPLLDFRRDQAGRLEPKRYKEFTGYCGYRRPDETKQTFLAHQGVAASNPANPDRGVPYYLLIVADPRVIPYRFQYELDIEYAVGRLWFEKDGEPDLDAFNSYARGVVAVESGKVPIPRRAVFFGVRHEGLAESTQLSADYLVKPLVERLSLVQEERKAKSLPAWTITNVPPRDATRANLRQFFSGADVPALLFTASHGVAFDKGDPLRLTDQGALLCQDWKGRERWGTQTIPPEFYFAARDVPDDSILLGLIAFHFACYGAGTPELDDYPYAEVFAREGGLAADAVKQRQPIADYPFVARLPQRLLGAPRGGALAVIGHIGRAWACSFFTWDVAREQTQVYESALRTLMDGATVGQATEYINQRYAAVAGPLARKLEDLRYGRLLDEPFSRELTRDWMAYNDAAAYVVVGDPAVRLPVGSLVAKGEVRPDLSHCRSEQESGDPEIGD
jgi:hypothetical protein